MWFYRNVGTRHEPILAPGVQLVSPGANLVESREPRRGVRAKICAVDYNCTGRLDLLVGDFTRTRAGRPGPATQEKQAKARKALVEVMEHYRSLESKLSGPEAVKDTVEREKAEKEMEALDKRRKELLKVAVPPEYETHGWVWLFKRKPAPQSAPR